MRARTWLVLGSWLLACSTSDSPPRDAGRASDAHAEHDARGDAGFDAGANLVGSLEDERRCMDVQRRLNTLMSSHQGCTTDEDCVVGQLDLPCFERFACTQAWSKSTEVAALKQTALALRDKYEQSCHRCATPECALSPADVRVFCDTGSKLCSYYSSRKPDAGAVPPLPPSPYACQGNDDCEIKWVGNCCAYPRCANSDAEFGHSSCPNQACDDGFSSYDHCECRENVCRTMFGETIVY